MAGVEYDSSIPQPFCRGDTREVGVNSTSGKERSLQNSLVGRYLYLSIKLITIELGLISKFSTPTAKLQSQDASNRVFKKTLLMMPLNGKHI